MVKVLLLFHGNLNVLLYILYKISYVKVIVVQNDTDLPVLTLISMF